MMNNDSPLMFRIPEETIKAYNNKFLLFVAFGLVLYGGIAVAIAAYNHRWPPDTASFIGFGMVLPILAFSLIRSLRRRKEILLSYAIVWDNLTITRKENGKKDLMLYHGEIRKIQQSKNGNLIVIGPSITENIVIPKSIEQKEALMALLEEVHPIEPFKATQQMWVLIVITYIAFLSFLASCFVYQKYSWVPMVALVINTFQLYRVFTHKQTTYRSKLWAILRVVLLIFMALYQSILQNIRL
jgi:hypothetical protein